MVCCKAGDLILWHSKLIHCNSAAILSKKEMRLVHSQKLKERMKEINGENTENDKESYEEKKEKVESNVKDIDGINVASLLRAVSYICMVPKMKVKDLNIIRQRIEAYETCCTCSHWPQRCVILGKPNGIKRQSVNDIKNDLIKSLIGIDMLKNNNNSKGKKTYI